MLLNIHFYILNIEILSTISKMKVQRRYISLFTKPNQENLRKLWVKRETLLDSFREKCDQNSHKIEKAIELCDSKSLLYMLKFSRDARIGDIPYFNKINKKFKELQSLVEAEKIWSTINE